MGACPPGVVPGPLGMELRTELTSVSVLCFQLPLRLFPDWASAGVGERTGGLFALSKIWGLCLSEVNPTPPLHSRSPKGDLITRLADVGSWVGGGAQGGRVVHNARATVEFQGRRPPMA